MDFKKQLKIEEQSVLPFTSKKLTDRKAAYKFFAATVSPKVIAEIGVRSGPNAKNMCEILNPDKIYCVDPYEKFGAHSQEKVNSWLEAAKKALSGFNAEFIRKKSIDAAKDIPNNSLDMVYIDGLHDFDNVLLDLSLWSEKVKPGGIISGHDYTDFPVICKGVVKAVNLFTQENNITEWFITGPEKLPSFFWIKK